MPQVYLTIVKKNCQITQNKNYTGKYFQIAIYNIRNESSIIFKMPKNYEIRVKIVELLILCYFLIVTFKHATVKRRN